MHRMHACLLLLCVLAMPAAWADDSTAPTPPPTGVPAWSTTKKLCLFEGLAVFNSGLAAASPQTMGAIILLTAPLAIAEDRNHGAEVWVGGGGYVAIGVFDASQPLEYSRPRVFLQNFAAWNLWGGVMLIMDEHGGAPKLADHLSIAPQAHGGVQVAYHWTF